MNTDSSIYVPAPAVRLMKSRVPKGAGLLCNHPRHLDNHCALSPRHQGPGCLKRKNQKSSKRQFFFNWREGCGSAAFLRGSILRGLFYVMITNSKPLPRAAQRRAQNAPFWTHFCPSSRLPCAKGFVTESLSKKIPGVVPRRTPGIP